MTIDTSIELDGSDAEQVGVIEAYEGDPVDVVDVPLSTTWADITSSPDGERPPIIPAWMRSPDQRRAVLKNMRGNVGYLVGFHSVRSPKYAVKTAVYAPRGLWRVSSRVAKWASAEEGNYHLRQKAADANDPHTWIALNRERKKTAGPRWTVVGIVTVPALVTLLTVAGLGVVPAVAWQAIGALLTVVFAQVGKPLDSPIIDRVTHGRRFTKLTGEMVRNAFVALGISVMRDPASIEFQHPGIHRDGPGWLAVVDLPPGLEAVKVLEKRTALAAAMRLPIDQVWPSVGSAHPGQVALWVSYVPVSQMGQPTWSLASDTAATSVFEAQPIGTDERMRPVKVKLFANNFLLGGQPGSGKSYGARCIATVAALDKLCELIICEFKGTGDFLDFAPMCSTYLVGIDDETLDAGAQVMAWLLGECAKRGERIRKFKAAGLAPQGKVTPELAAMPGSGLHPICAIFDEAHELFGHSKESAANAERAIKRGRALGITIVLATQIPDKTSLPPNITRCVTVRWCMSVVGQIENDLILGTGAYKRGLSATVYRPELDAGWGVMRGAQIGPVRSYFPTTEETATIAARAMALRGGVVGERIDPATVIVRDMLADARAVLRDGESGLPWGVLAERLIELDPAVYEGLTADMVRESLARYGVETLDVTVKAPDTASGYRRIKGMRRTELEKAEAAKAIAA